MFDAYVSAELGVWQSICLVRRCGLGLVIGLLLNQVKGWNLMPGQRSRPDRQL